MATEQNYKFKSYIGMAFAGLGAFLFGTMTTARLTRIFIQGTAHYFLFSSFVALNIINLLNDMIILWKSENRNMDVVSMFVIDLLMALVMGIAVVGGFVLAAVFAAISPILFTGAMALNAAFTICKALYCGLSWALTKDADSRERFKEEFINHTIGAVISTAAAVFVGLLMVFQIAPFAMSIVNVAVNVVALALGIYSIIKSATSTPASTRQPVPEQVPAITVTAPTDSPRLDRLRNAPEPIAQPEPLLIEKPAKDGNYFYRRKLDTTTEDSTAKLLSIINAKKDELNENIARDQRSIIAPQLSKRLAKQEALQKLSELVNNPTSTISNFNDLKSSLAPVSKRLGQSFFRERSDTNCIIDIAEAHFANRPAVATR